MVRQKVVLLVFDLFITHFIWHQVHTSTIWFLLVWLVGAAVTLAYSLSFGHRSQASGKLAI